jgi:peptidyl-prolyl cis-trans isomerase C
VGSPFEEPDMLKKISPRLTLLSVGLALLLSLSTACKPKAEESVMKTDNTATGQTAAPPSGTASTATPGSPTAPGELPPLAGAPGAVPGQPGANPADNTPMATDKIPAVVAKVNGQAIKKEDLLKGGQVVQMRLAQMGRQVAPSAAFYRQVLNELIAITLLQQDAKAQGVTPSDQEVQQMLAAQKSRFQNEAAYKQALQQAGITEETLRQQARDQLAVQKYVQTRIAGSINVPDQAARDFYAKNKDKMQMPERVHLRHILIQVPQNAPAADKEKAKQKAAGILKRLQAGEDFAKLAAETSDDAGSKTRGGDVGFLARGQNAPPTFEAAAFALQKPNDLSGVVESPLGYHIIQLVEKQPASTVPFEQVKDRIVAGLKEQEVQKMVAARAGQLRSKGKVEVFI